MESIRQNNNINAIKELESFLMMLEITFIMKKKKRIRKKLHRIEAVYNVLKNKENKGSLTSRQKNMLINYERCLKNITKHLKNLKNILKNINMV